MWELIGPVERAAYETVHGFVDRRTGARGAVALAPKIGMTANALSNRVNPEQEHAKLGLSESIQVQVAAGDYRILHAYASVLGHVAYQLPEGIHSDAALLTQWAEFTSAVGKKSEALRLALEDNSFTQAEVDEIRRRLHAAIRAGLQLLARIEGLSK